MSRARILADYVSSGDELALKAPIAGPTFTGTVAIPNVANLETAVVANTAKTTNATHSGDVTGGTALTIADNAVSLAKMAGGTDGNLITYDTSGDPAYVATGTSGHVLTSAGADAVPAFAAAAAGGGITHASQWRVIADSGTLSSLTVITNVAEVTMAGDIPNVRLGAAMTEEDGIFEFPVEGYWYITFKPRIWAPSLAARSYNKIYVTADSAPTVGEVVWGSAAECELYCHVGAYQTTFCDVIFKVLDKDKSAVEFLVHPNGNKLVGNPDSSYSSMTFIRLGDL